MFAAAVNDKSLQAAGEYSLNVQKEQRSLVMDEQQVPTPNQASNEKLIGGQLINHSSGLLHNHNNSDFISRASRRNESRLFSARSKD